MKKLPPGIIGYRVIVRTTDDRRFVFHRSTWDRAKRHAENLTHYGFKKAFNGALRFYPPSSVRVAVVEPEKP